jgi:hypothetical protein
VRDNCEESLTGSSAERESGNSASVNLPEGSPREFSRRDATTELIEIPADSIIESEGQAAGSGLINVLWEGDAFSVFYEDLREKAEILTA